MKKKPYPLARRAGVCLGAAAISASMLTGCNWFDPDRNEPEEVYGPPQDFEDFSPEDNMPESVYGPEWMLDGYDHDPAEDVPEPVYGPPEVTP